MSSFSKHCIQLVFNSWLPLKATMVFSTISSCALFKVCEFNSFTRLFSRSMKKLYAWSEMWSSPLSQDCFPFVTCRVSRNIEFSPVLNMVRWRSLKLASDLVGLQLWPGWNCSFWKRFFEYIFWHDSGPSSQPSHQHANMPYFWSTHSNH